MTIRFCSISASFPYFAQAIENNITGVAPDSFTLAAVEELDGNVVGYVHCKRSHSDSISLASCWVGPGGCFNFFCLFPVSRKWEGPELGILVIDHKPEIPNPVSPGKKDFIIGHLKVDWEHQGRGIGHMLILSHSGNVFCLSVILLKKNGKLG